MRIETRWGEQEIQLAMNEQLTAALRTRVQAMGMLLSLQRAERAMEANEEGS